MFTVEENIFLQADCIFLISNLAHSPTKINVYKGQGGPVEKSSYENGGAKIQLHHIIITLDLTILILKFNYVLTVCF